VLIVKLLALELGALLIYAGVKGKSVGALLMGDNATAAQNQSVTANG
jgi:hypothetical protein